jgi:small subunit ribosomal protein S17
MMSETKNIRTVIGEVVSTSRDKTIAIKVERKKIHPKYKKPMRVTSKFHAHIEEKGLCNMGDLVKIEACRPISKTKTWRFVEVVERAK